MSILTLNILRNVTEPKRDSTQLKNKQFQIPGDFEYPEQSHRAEHADANAGRSRYPGVHQICHT